MRILRDDIYLFSMARSCPGDIVACRAANRDGAIGRNINDVLSLDADDVAYAMSRSDSEEYRSVCLSCYPNGKQKVVAFFDFACRSASLCLAVVFDLKPKSVARALSLLGENNACLCPSLSTLCDDRFFKEDQEAYIYVSYVYGCVAPIGELRACHSMSSAEFLRPYVELAADFVGIDFEYASQSDNSLSCFSSESVVFAGGFCSAAILTAAFLARRFSADCKLFVGVMMVRDRATVTFAFDTSDKNAVDGVNMLEAVADTYGIYLQKDISSGRFELTTMPFYSDVGFVGVKERDPYPPITFFYD